MKKFFTLICITAISSQNCCAQNLHSLSEQLIVTPDPNTQNPHLIYKALNVTNINPNQATIISNIIIPKTGLANNLIQYCDPKNSSCDIPTNQTNPTCTVGLQLMPWGSCNLWLQATNFGKTATPQEFAITIETPTKHYNQTFVVNYEQDLYVGGRFNHWPTSTSAVVKWDGSNWSTLPGLNLTDYDDAVMSLAYKDNYLYAGGDFHGYVARYNLDSPTTQWESLPGLHDAAQTLINFAEQIYAGGEFAGAYRLNGNSKWEQVGALENGVGQYATINQQLYAAGQFPEKVVTLNLDKNSWSKVGSDLTAEDNEILIAFNNYLYTGGHFNAAQLYKCSLLEQTKWAAIGTDAPYQMSVLSAAIFQQQLFLGTMDGLFSLNNDTLTPIFPKTLKDARINSLLSLGNSLYIGSNIDTAATSLNWLAKYDNNQWIRVAPKEWDEIQPEINALLAIPTWNIASKN